MWKDISSFSRSDKDRTPKTWEFKGVGIRVIVTRNIHYAPDVWLARCEPYFSYIELKNKDIDAAKEEAMAIVKNCVRKALASLDA